MSGLTPCWSAKQICIKIHVPSLSCPSTSFKVIYISNLGAFLQT